MTHSHVESAINCNQTGTLTQGISKRELKVGKAAITGSAVEKCIQEIGWEAYHMAKVNI